MSEVLPTPTGPERLANTVAEATTPHPPPAKTQVCNPVAGLPPELIDHPRYRIVRPLGAGGMGVVFQAEHRLMERTVALKVINRQFTSHPTAVERFRREVRAAARLTHPNIVTAHDAEQAGELHYLVMEFVEGISFIRLVQRKGPLPVANACHYVRQAALGLQHAFEKGMVHRDVKPHNLMLTRKGQVKILDFGLARLAREQGLGDSLPPIGSLPDTAAGITAAGTVLGTPDYIAPEQAHDSRNADIRADIYSLGCTLYFLLAGRPPFPQGTALEKLLAHVDRTPPPLSQFRSDVPAELVAILDRMLAKDPAQRYQTPAEVAQALAQLAKAGAALPPAAVPAPAAQEPQADAVADNPFLLTPLADVPIVVPPLTRKVKKANHRPWLSPRTLGAVAAGVVLVVALLAVVLGRGLRTMARGPARVSGGAAVAATEPGGRSQVAKPAAGSRQRQVLYVLPQKGLWLDDYEPVRRLLDEKGVRVVPASSRLTPCQLHPVCKGEPVVPQVRLDDDVRAADYDALVFAGLEVQEFVFPKSPARRQVSRLLDEMLAAEGKYVAALCTGQLVLAKHDRLEGKQAAFNQKVYDLGRFKGIRWVHAPVVQDGRIITGANPENAEDFARVLLRCLGLTP